MDYEGLLVANLPLVDSVVRAVAHRYWLPADETDDLGGDIRLKLVEHDYEVLRKFEERSSLRTYLTTVVLRHLLDQRNARWGKWRPSIIARRLGHIAMFLEQLLNRDHLSFDEAVETVLARHGDRVSRDELHEIMLQLPPPQSSRQFVGEDGIEEIPEPDSGEDTAIASLDRQTLGGKIHRALTIALERLGDEDRAIVRLRFCERVKLNDIARLFGVPAKPFYKRVDDLKAQLRLELEAQGVTHADVAAILGDSETVLDEVVEGIVSRKTGPRPSVL